MDSVTVAQVRDFRGAILLDEVETSDQQRGRRGTLKRICV